MPLYEYKAYNMHGKVYRSHLESTTLEKAKAKLIELSIPFVNIREKKQKKRQSIKRDSLLYFTSQLAQLLEADIPLYESLNLLKEQFQNESLAPILDQLIESLKAGLSFSETLKNFPQHFSPFYYTLVQMGEESGHLDEALRRISIELSREKKILRHIQMALLYPSILLGFCLVLISVLIFYIIPSIESLFESASTNLFTQSVISICHHLKDFGFIYIILLVGVLLASRLLYHTRKYRIVFDQALLKIPLIKTLLLEITFARWTSTMAMLLKAGVTLLDALKLSSELIENLVLKNALHECQKRISEGVLLSFELKKNNLFPSLLIQMIYIGENSGELAHSFDRLAEIYEENVDKKMSKFMTLLSPIVLIIMALIIGIIMLAILIPLTDINSFSL